jgi:hypothetical protein
MLASQSPTTLPSMNFAKNKKAAQRAAFTIIND